MRPGRVPRPADTFFGRTDELLRVAAWLDQRVERVLTIWGPGGMGKTRLTLEALHRAFASGGLEPGAVLYCPIEKARRPSDIHQIILDEADVELLPGQSGSAHGVARRLESWPGSLIVLDAAEADAATVGEIVAAVLAAHDGVRFLVTSQVVLGLKAETLLPLGPLDSSASLFADRASRVRPGYHITPDDEPAVARLLARLEGNPLAIEMAATRMGVLDASRILARLEETFQSLSTSAVDVPERHRSMPAVLGWTWSHLPAPVQAVLGRASVLCGSFNLVGLAAVVDLPEAEITQALETLRSFALVAAADVEGIGLRYEIREAVREFARQKLTPADEDAAWRRCAAHYRERFLSQFRAFAASGDPKYRLSMTIEQGNASGLYSWALRAGDDDMAVGTAFVLCGPLLWRGLLRETIEVAERTLAEHGAGATEPLRVALELRQWDARIGLDPATVDVAALEALAQLAERIGESVAQAYAYRYLAAGARHRGDHARALDADRKGIAIAATMGDRTRLKALHSLAASLLGAGDLDAAAEQVDDAMFLAREIGDEDELAAGISLLAELAVRRHDLGHAEKLLRRVLEMCARDGRWQHPREHETRLLLGKLQQARGNLDEARTHLSTTLERARLEGRVWLRARCAMALAALEHQHGDLAAATSLLAEARARLDDGVAEDERAAFWAQRAALAADLGRRDGAATALAQAEQLARSPVARALVELAGAHLGDAETAARAIERLCAAHPDLEVRLAANILAARSARDKAPTGGAYEFDRERRVVFVPDGDVIDLSRRGSIRRVFEELLARHPAGAALTVDEVFAIGWPEQRVAPEAAANRVYNAISTLRKLGLGDALEAISEGYRLRPHDRWTIVGTLAGA